MSDQETRQGTPTLEQLLERGEVAFAVLFEPGVSQHTIEQARKAVGVASDYYQERLRAVEAERDAAVQALRYIADDSHPFPPTLEGARKRARALLASLPAADTEPEEAA